MKKMMLHFIKIGSLFYKEFKKNNEYNALNIA